MRQFVDNPAVRSISGANIEAHDTLERALNGPANGLTILQAAKIARAVERVMRAQGDLGVLLAAIERGE
jgi:hypothetical protein